MGNDTLRGDVMKKYTWKEAHKAVEKRGGGWRMPTRAELVSIIDDTRVNPACKLLDMQPTDYWSSTPYACHTDSAWYVDFYGGAVVYYSKNDCYSVRPVRDTKDGIEWGPTL
jgi:hypothetical protein